jgi:hypothetical protein
MIVGAVTPARADLADRQPRLAAAGEQLLGGVEDRAPRRSIRRRAAPLRAGMGGGIAALYWHVKGV